jgi:hypothetical protein
MGSVVCRAQSFGVLNNAGSDWYDSISSLRDMIEYAQILRPMLLMEVSLLSKAPLMKSYIAKSALV